ncbi:hypothetical protein AGMMS49950_03250 [Endomicrobiia bacterium]|nr:hypothetical protein AGMMS49950_03250 [Endomicrobiia bacterium]
MFSYNDVTAHANFAFTLVNAAAAEAYITLAARALDAADVSHAAAAADKANFGTTCVFNATNHAPFSHLDDAHTSADDALRSTYTLRNALKAAATTIHDARTLVADARAATTTTYNTIFTAYNAYIASHTPLPTPD